MIDEGFGFVCRPDDGRRLYPASQWDWVASATSPHRGRFVIDRLNDQPIEGGMEVTVLGCALSFDTWLADRIAALGASRPALFADPVDAAEYDALSPGWQVTRYPGEGLAQIFDFGDVAKGECRANQSGTVSRSNFRSLCRDHSECADGAPCFTMIAYDNVDALAGFAHLVCADLVESVRGLRLGHPVYDEEDLGALEMDDISASWEQYLRDDIRNDLPDGDREVWDLVPAEELESAFWRILQEFPGMPEHTGTEIRWSDFLGTYPVVDQLVIFAYRRADGTLCTADGCVRAAVPGQRECVEHSTHPTLLGA